ncbi:unnamed protein product [Rodentolepis nana]|uniref:HMA domain-containing protein n=1 Tax=Rodentolepis nana TaxID=102285 RepID=A0A0R3TF39_RODNA|nr:unnamed protein product [Rodentolepis nana]
MDESDQEQDAKSSMTKMCCIFKSEYSIDALMASTKAAILEYGVLPNVKISQDDSILNIDGTVKASISKKPKNEVIIEFEYPVADYKKYVDAFSRVGIEMYVCEIANQELCFNCQLG